jgi:CheY-like chemotaxis protein
MDLTDKKVLVVEEDLETRIFLARVVQSAGCRPILSPNCRDGLNQARRYQPDLILLNAIISKSGRLEMFDDLKQDDGLRGIPVILFSNLEEDVLFRLKSPVRPSEQSRPEGFLAKPLEAEELLHLMEGCLSGPRRGDHGV